MVFKIDLIHVDMHRENPHLRIEFRSDDLSNYGSLNEFVRAAVIPDVEAYRAYCRNSSLSLDDLAELEEKDEVQFEWRPKGPTCFDLGLRRFEYIEGAGVIESLGDGRYCYEQYIADCLITRACILQIAEMQDEMERGYCRWGNYPNQAGAFRSGDPEHDFGGVLQTLDRFWD